MNYFYYSSSRHAISTGFLANRVVDFFIETQWPEPYRQDFTKLIEYAHDIRRRAVWSTAGRHQWAGLVQMKLPQAIRNHLPTLEKIFAGYLHLPARLVMEVQSLGDAVLTGDDDSKMPLLKIVEVENRLKETCGDVVDAEVERGASTDALLIKVYKHINGARAEKSLAGLGSKSLPIMRQGSDSVDEVQDVFQGGLSSETVQPRAP